MLLQALFFPGLRAGQSPEVTGMLLYQATLPTCRDCLPPRLVLGVELVLCWRWSQALFEFYMAFATEGMSTLQTGLSSVFMCTMFSCM